MVSWGSLYPVSKFMMSGISPLTMAFFRYITGTLTLAVFFIIENSKNSNRIPVKDKILIALLGLPGITIFSVLLFSESTCLQHQTDQYLLTASR